MARTKHRAAKEHDRKWREKNKLKVKINNMDSYGKIVKKRVEDPDLHAKMKAAQTERTRLCRARAKERKALLASASSSPDPPPSEPAPSASSSAPTEEPPVPVPASEPSGRRTRAATPAQLLESDQEDVEAPSNKLVEGL